MAQKEKAASEAEVHVNINLTLVFIVFTLFTFIVTINEKILTEDFLLSAQLVLSIVFFIASLFARSTLISYPNIKYLDGYGFICFVIAYATLTNTIGILIGTIVSLNLSIMFFVLSIITPLIYSSIRVLNDRKKLWGRVYKDLWFIILIVVFGLLHVVGIY